MPKFFTAYNTRGTEPSPTGNGYEPTFEYKVNTKGVKELVQTGKTCLYDKIQASAKQCEVYSILDRFENTGDVSLLKKAEGQFGDFSQFPKTLAERQQQLINAEAMFNQLPLKARKEFGNSFTQFLASFEDGTYKDIFSKFGMKEEKPDVDTGNVPTTLPESVQQPAQQTVQAQAPVQQTVQQPNFNPLQQGANT